uniref:AP complex subunit sigma n=1 Tax=Steinernema glaseri TaxID=37863 RepID=A0A1I8AWN2_9BILA
MIHFFFCFNKQGKLRLQKWYSCYDGKTKKRMMAELATTIMGRKRGMCSFLEYAGLRVVYRRYASLYFACAVDLEDNELYTLEVIHRFVQLLDVYFGSVCELDVIFNFEKVYYILDEFLLAGEVQEAHIDVVLQAVCAQDELQEELTFGSYSID